MYKLVFHLLVCFTLEISTKSLKDKVFLLVFDGFVHDFEKLTSNMPNFAKLAKQGIKGKGLIPPFPSATFPSMVTLTTGLYPESHGIIDNYFYDEEGALFSWTGDPNDPNNAKFFTQEPIWLTNQKELRGTSASSVYYWPGYYAFKEKPNYHNKRITPFGASITTGREAIDETFEYYDNDPSLNFMVVYVDAPDNVAHAHGKSSMEYKDRIEALDDQVLGYLMEKLAKYPEINLIVTADHGHINKDPSRQLYISDYVGDEMLADGGRPYCSTHCKLRPAEGFTPDQVLEYLAPLFETGGFRVFNKENPYDQFPESLHFSKHKLIPPILILPEPGWLLLDKRVDTEEEHDLAPELSWAGVHGYDPIDCKDMHSIFFARGPAFKRGVTIEPFESVNVYPLLAHLLGIKPRPNNGSLSVFKYVLKEWNPSFETEDANSSSFNFGFIVVIVVLVLVLIFYFVTQSAAGSKSSFRVKKNV